MFSLETKIHGEKKKAQLSWTFSTRHIRTITTTMVGITIVRAEVPAFQMFIDVYFSHPSSDTIYFNFSQRPTYLEYTRWKDRPSPPWLHGAKICGDVTGSISWRSYSLHVSWRLWLGFESRISETTSFRNGRHVGYEVAENSRIVKVEKKKLHWKYRHFLNFKPTALRTLIFFQRLVLGTQDSEGA